MGRSLGISASARASRDLMWLCLSSPAHPAWPQQVCQVRAQVRSGQSASAQLSERKVQQVCHGQSASAQLSERKVQQVCHGQSASAQLSERKVQQVRQVRAWALTRNHALDKHIHSASHRRRLSSPAHSIAATPVTDRSACANTHGCITRCPSSPASSLGSSVQQKQSNG